MQRFLILLMVINAQIHAENAIQAGQLDIDPPTLIGSGFQWWVDGDDNQNARLTVSYRQQGEMAWREGLKPSYHPAKSLSGYVQVMDFEVGKHFAGSIIELTEDTSYEIRLVLEDPDGGGAEQIVQTRTRAVPQPAADGRQIEIWPDREPGFEDALQDLRPGDRLLLHAGTYTPPALEAPASPSSQEGARMQPGSGRVLHVYPPKWKGEKQEPHFRNLMEVYHGRWWTADFNFHTPNGVQPGDTIVVHAGTYRPNRFNYRDTEGLWQHGTYLFTRKGTAEQPITIKAAGDGPVVFEGAHAFRLFDLQAAEHHVFEGLTLREAYIGMDLGNAAKDLQAQGVVIQDCVIDEVWRGISGWRGTDTRVLGTSISEGAYPDRFEGSYVIATDGTAEQPITIQAYGDGEVVIDGQDSYCLFDTMAADHLLFDGLTIRNAFMSIFAARMEQLAAVGLTVRNCRFENIQNGIFGKDGRCRDFTILDNVFYGRARENNNPGGYVVNLSGAGHSVGYNFSDAFWDHLNVSTCSLPIEGYRAWSMDFYNNICIRATDNSFELDGTMWNVRFMHNLCAFSNSFAFSSQNTWLGPAYYYGNILYWGGGCKILRSGDVYFYHNTANVPGIGGARVNNCFLQPGFELGKTSGKKNKAVVVIDEDREDHHNAYRIGDPDDQAPGGYDGPHGKADSFTAYRELSQNGVVQVDFDDLVRVPKPDWENYPYRDPDTVDARTLDFRPADGSPLIDAGAVIPGLHRDVTGSAPDIGALEHGMPVPQYGPRTQPVDR